MIGKHTMNHLLLLQVKHYLNVMTSATQILLASGSIGKLITAVEQRHFVQVIKHGLVIVIVQPILWSPA
jgi:hypothetical protein